MHLSTKLGFEEDRFIVRPAISTLVGPTMDYAQWWKQVKEVCPFWKPASSKAVMGLVTHGHKDSIAFLINVEAKTLAIYHDEETDISYFVQIVSLYMATANHQYTDLFESFFKHLTRSSGMKLDLAKLDIITIDHEPAPLFKSFSSVVLSDGPDRQDVQTVTASSNVAGVWSLFVVGSEQEVGVFVLIRQLVAGRKL